MRRSRIIEDVVRRVHEAIPMEAVGEDLRRNLAEMVGAALARMDLVTREEFEAEVAVLEHAKQRIEALEARVEALESTPAGRASGSTADA